MPLILSDFTFTKLPAWQSPNIAIQFTDYADWLTTKVTVNNTTLEYECNHTEESLPQLLEAFIDIIWEYAATDKYFGYARTRSRVQHDAESKGMVVWDLRYHANTTTTSYFDILIRNNIDVDLEDDDLYYHYRDPETIKKVQGDVWLCVTVDTSDWVKALLKACDEFLEKTPATPEHEDGWCKAQFPTALVDKLRTWLTTPDDSYKWQKLNPGKRFFDNQDMISGYSNE
jgi:hypothetical protein